MIAASREGLRTRGMLVRLVLLVLMLAVGLPAHAETPPPRSYTRAVERIEALYLDIDQVQPRDLLLASAHELAIRIDWLVVDVQGGLVRLSHGKGRELGHATATTWAELPAALFALEEAVRISGYAYGDLDLRHATLYGATLALDRYSRVMVGDGLDRFDTRLKGTLVGIGARLGLVGGRLRVLDTYPGSPAIRGGLLVGDRIERIDGTSTVNMPVREASRRIRGDAGSAVVLDVIRGPEGEPVPLRLSLAREDVILPNVASDVLEGGVGYVHIDHVSQKTVYNFRRAMAELVDRGGLSRGLVLDLRGNTGGSMKESAGIVDQFVENGLLLSTEGRDGRPVENLMARMDARDAGDEPPVPVVVLVDRSTASGAEIIVGGLLGHQRVGVLGQRTYGKGLVQKIYELEDDARLKLTVAEYVLVDQQKVGREGLRPDVTFGRVELRADGVRFDVGWDMDREGVHWDDVVPVVDEGQGWRNHASAAGDVVLEAARRAVLAAPTPDRAGVLEGLAQVVPGIRASQEAHLTEALEAHGIDWSAAHGPGAAPEARVSLEVRPLPGTPDRLAVHATVVNEGPTTLYRALVRLRCETFGGWDDLVVPIGAVASGATGAGSAIIELAPGIEPREDRVGVELHAHRRPALELPPQRLPARSTPAPRLRVEGHLVGEGTERVAVLTVHNLGQVDLTGLEADFAWPRHVDVELLEHASRRAALVAGGTAVFELGMHLGPEAPRTIPMRLRLDADGFGRLLAWELPLHVDGATVRVEAPAVASGALRTSAPAGELVLPIEVRDDGQLASVAVFLNREKVLFDAGGTGRIVLRPELVLVPGENHLVVRATDDQGIVEQRAWSILGLTDGEGVTTGGE